MKTHKKQDRIFYLISPTIWIYVMFILIYLHKIILFRLKKHKSLTTKYNLKVHLVVGVSSMNIHFGEILWSKKQTQAILKVKEQRRNTLQIKKPTY